MALAAEARGADRRWSLHDLLSVPYLLHAGTVETAPGIWMRQASYPELPDCQAEAPTIEEALRLLERERIQIIMRTVGDGACPPVPRPPLAGCDPRVIAAEIGLHQELAAALARDTAGTKE